MIGWLGVDVVVTLVERLLRKRVNDMNVLVTPRICEPDPLGEVIQCHGQ